MVLTTLSVCLQTVYPHGRQRSPLLRSIMSGLFLVCVSLVSACGSGGDSPESLIISSPPASSPGTAAVSLQWDEVPDPTVSGYFVYYGTHSPNQTGSCAYSGRLFTNSTLARVKGLAPNTQYFFAVTAYNGLESPCSAEVSTVTQFA